MSPKVRRYHLRPDVIDTSMGWPRFMEEYQIDAVALAYEIKADWISRNEPRWT